MVNRDYLSALRRGRQRKSRCQTGFADVVPGYAHCGFANGNAIVIHADGVWHRMRSSGTDSARTRSRAPGRTGKAGTRRVSIAHMLNAETDIAGLRTRFISEVTL
jgi:hypothetical protein